MQEWGPQLAVILGIVEGLTEFLPVSSTGHLILVGHLLGFTGEIATSIEISIQLGAILAVIVYERVKIASLLTQSSRELTAFRAMVRDTQWRHGKPFPAALKTLMQRSAERHRNLWFLLGLGAAFLPAAVIGLLTHRWIELYLFNPRSVATALIAGGVVILLVESLRRRVRFDRLDQIGVPIAVWVGIAQCASLIPGVSRSGATIVGGLLVGMDRRLATEYSFFLALPAMMAATVYKAVQSKELLTTSDLLALLVGLLVAFFVAWGVIAVFLAFVKRHSLRAFAFYRFGLGALVLVVVQ